MVTPSCRTLTWGADLGSASYRFNNLWVANINSNSSQAFSGQTTFSYAPTDTTISQASVLINPTTSAANGQLLGLSIAGYQKALIDEDGDIILGYSDATSAPATDYPLDIYGHSGTRVSFVDTSGNAYFAGNVGVGTTSPSQKLDVRGNIAIKEDGLIGGGLAYGYAAGAYSSTIEMYDSPTGNIIITPGVNTIFASGKVGIGTTSPAELLEINKSQNAGTKLLLSNTNTGTAAYTGLNFAANGITGYLRAYSSTYSTAAYADRLILGTDSSASGLSFSSYPGDMRFLGGGSETEFMRLSSTGGLALGNSYVGTDPGAGSMIISGSVGIGTTAPSTLLHLYGGSLRSASTATRYSDFGPGDWYAAGGDVNVRTTGNYPFYLGTNNTARLAISGAGGLSFGDSTYTAVNPGAGNVIIQGNVGIGTTSPTSKLHVSGAVTGKALAIFDETGDQNIFTASASGTTRMVLTNAGNLGIGTTGPSYLFQVGGTTPNFAVDSTSHAAIGTTPHSSYALRIGSGVLRFEGSGSISMSGGGSIGGSGDININPSSGNVLLNPTSGNVGIGTTNPQDELHIYKSAAGSVVDFNIENAGNTAGTATRLLMSYGGSQAIAGLVESQLVDSTNSFMRFYTRTSGSATEKVRIDNNGNVGIGTTSPISKLHISGAVTGKALTILDETGDQAILTASASGVTKFTVGNDGTVTTALGTGTVYSNAGVLTNTDPSDRELKNNILVLPEGTLDKVLGLKPVSFSWKSTGDGALGFIAQDVAQVFPELVGSNPDGTLGLYTTQFIPVLAKAIQEQQLQIDEISLSSRSGELTHQRSLLDSLRNTVTDISETINTILARLTRLEERQLAGRATISQYTDRVDIVFKKPFSELPVVTFTLSTSTGNASFLPDGQDAILENVTPDGFSIRLPATAIRDYTFHWIAVSGQDAAETASTSRLAEELDTQEVAGTATISSVLKDASVSATPATEATVSGAL